MPSNSTIKVDDTLAWIAGFIVQRTTKGVGGTTGEPGLTSANMIYQTILGPQFTWMWNRATTSITCIAGTTDYVKTLTDFGHLEKAWGVLASNTPPNFELEIAEMLGVDGKNNRPQKIAAVTDDNANSITFRVFPPPDKAYVITVAYQKAAALMSATSSTWAPIPDKFAYVYERGLKAMMHGMYNVELYLSEMNLFLKQLVGLAEGLSEAEKAIFLEDRMRIARMSAGEMTNMELGRRTRT